MKVTFNQVSEGSKKVRHVEIWEQELNKQSLPSARDLTRISELDPQSAKWEENDKYFYFRNKGTVALCR